MMTQQEAIERLKASDAVTVGADDIAPCLRMSPSVLRQHVKDGNYHISKYDIQGGRIRFFRKDFLVQIGEIEPDPPERTEMAVLEEISANMVLILSAITAMMNQEQRREFVGTWADEEDIRRMEEQKESAGVAAPTET